MGQLISSPGFVEERLSMGADETNLISTDGSSREIVRVRTGQENLISTDDSGKEMVPIGADEANLDLSNGQCISSPIFKSCGYKWTIRFFPNGYDEEDNGKVAVFLELLSDSAKLHVNFTIAILDKSGSKPLKLTSTGKFKNAPCMLGWRHFKKMTDLDERSKEDISMLWESGEMADVQFEVNGEIICGHKVILAARSSVFKAELKSHMAGKKIGCIRIDDMKPEVFRALLQFIYKNSLDNKRDTHWATSVMTQNLLAAASRYAIEGLIVSCEAFLMDNLSLDTVMDVLILAEQHCLFKLKEACLEFASSQENLTELSLTDGYIHMAQACPSLWSELKKKVTE
ncbi:BTB/POZ/MATH-domain protein [Rhynchospora pubera]|uniref:BTB/POZ/MATH-domain protein n=1 Tax=Rhynchospora pubera TaxID=906938 RepID=A0AAV8EC18_9POAL|nr:BTB/POZ/MATH-domain protein [Rhynchospora pubera]